MTSVRYSNDLGAQIPMMSEPIPTNYRISFFESDSQIGFIFSYQGMESSPNRQTEPRSSVNLQLFGHNSLQNRQTT